MMKKILAFSTCGLLAAACGGGGSEAVGLGTADVVLTDAPADGIEQFTVDVSAIVLTKRGGSTVSVLPRATRVDFARLASIGELVAGCQLESGSYTSLSLVLDFSDAEVVVAGQTELAVVRDCDGAILDGPLAVDIDFADGASPVVGVTRRHLFQLDLDLDQSLSVDAAANEVTFCPVLHVEVDPSNPRPIATSGVLQRVSTDDLRFALERRSSDGSGGEVFTVQTGGDTVFQIDGVVHVGAPGLGALIGVIGQQVWVQGTLDQDRQLLRAIAVEAGAGVPGNGQDSIAGHVVARTGAAGAEATLTVRGRSRGVGGACRYGSLHTVTVSFADTKVLRRCSGADLDTDAINVGQEVEVFGDLDGTTLDATAATGVVRLVPTSIQGAAAGAPAADRLTLDVERFGALEPSRFDFSVAGEVQADPDAFVFDVAGLVTTGIAAGDRLRLLAWINPVGIPDDAAARAISVADRDHRGVDLKCLWAPPSDTVVLGTTPTSITLDVTDAHDAKVGKGPSAIALAGSPAPVIRPAAAFGKYKIVGGGRGAAHRQFDSFQAAVAARAATRSIVRVNAKGTFDATTQEFRATSVTFVFAR